MYIAFLMLGLRVGFTTSSYSASEAQEEVDVCVRVVSGQLGTDITLQVVTGDGTAIGKFICSSYDLDIMYNVH